MLNCIHISCRVNTKDDGQNSHSNNRYMSRKKYLIPNEVTKSSNINFGTIKSVVNNRSSMSPSVQYTEVDNATRSTPT
jgi:hypothetical protein